jgi:formylmethanofuran dehydrogenase subunit E
MKKKRVCSICLNVVSEDEAIIDEEGRLLCIECFKKTYPLEESEEDEVT